LIAKRRLFAGFAAGCGRSAGSSSADQHESSNESAALPDVMHGVLFAAPVGRAAQDHRLVGLGWRVSSTSTPWLTMRQSWFVIKLSVPHRISGGVGRSERTMKLDR
jgi:hypothetical protein